MLYQPSKFSVQKMMILFFFRSFSVSDSSVLEVDVSPELVLGVGLVVALLAAVGLAVALALAVGGVGQRLSLVRALVLAVTAPACENGI